MGASRGCSISSHRQLHPPISLLGHQIMKLWWIVLEKQVNYIERNYIDEMEKYIDEIVPGMKLREAWNSPFHWKPLGKQWTWRFSISLKTIGKTMKLMPHRCCSISLKTVGKQWNGSLLGTSPIHWKPLGKQWNWMNRASNDIPSTDHYIRQLHMRPFSGA